MNQVAFLRTTREFPEEAAQLTIEVNKAYLDIANAVNNRTISIYPTNRPAITGENWFITNQRRQTLREVYYITSVALPIPHGITFFSNIIFTNMYGQFTDSPSGDNWYGFLPGGQTALAGQRTFWIDNTNINFLAGAGAQTFVKGIIILEWLSSP